MNALLACMIDVTRLEELQRAISTMEWDIQNGQFNKHKATYYRKLLEERDGLLQSKSVEAYNKAANAELEVEGDEEDNEDNDWDERFEDRQIVGI